MGKPAENEILEKTLPPHKARILVIVGAVFLLHAVLLLFLWPHRWPKSYKWLLLPDSVGAYFVLALGVQQLRENKISGEAHEGTDKVTM